MFENMENLKFDSMVCKVSKPYSKVHNRAKHAFNIRIKGGMYYDFEGKKLTVKAGEMIFIPKGSNFSYRIFPDSESTCVSINFDGDFFLHDFAKSNVKGRRFYLRREKQE